MNAFDEIKQAMGMWRGIVPTRRALRRYREALAFSEQGLTPAAFDAVGEALDLLRRRNVDPSSPATLTLYLPAAELRARLAISLGKADLARGVMRQALELCHEVVEQHPAMKEWEHLAAHVQSFEQRVRELDLLREP